MGKLRKEWAKLVLFFSQLATLIETALKTQTQDFLNASKTIVELTQKGNYTMSNMMRDRLFMGAQEATKVAVQVTRISGVYLRVSKDYMLPQVNALGELIYLSGEQDKAKIQQKKQELLDACSKGESGIVEEAQRSNAELKAKAAKRVQDINNALNSMPAASDAIKQASKAIQNAPAESSYAV